MTVPCCGAVQEQAPLSVARLFIGSRLTSCLCSSFASLSFSFAYENCRPICEPLNRTPSMMNVIPSITSLFPRRFLNSTSTPCRFSLSVNCCHVLDACRVVFTAFCISKLSAFCIVQPFRSGLSLTIGIRQAILVFQLLYYLLTASAFHLI